MFDFISNCQIVSQVIVLILLQPTLSEHYKIWANTWYCHRFILLILAFLESKVSLYTLDINPLPDIYMCVYIYIYIYVIDILSLSMASLFMFLTLFWRIQKFNYDENWFF